MAGGLRGLACRQILHRRPLTSLEVLWRLQTPSTCVRGVPPLTDGAAAGTWRGETDASGLHGGDLAVGLPRMLLQCVPMGLPNTTRWGGPLVKARPCKVKGLDPVVKRYRVRRDGGPGGRGSNATQVSHRTLTHAGWCGGMSEEAGRVSGAWPPSRTAMTR